MAEAVMWTVGVALAVFLVTSVWLCPGTYRPGGEESDASAWPCLLSSRHFHDSYEAPAAGRIPDPLQTPERQNSHLPPLPSKNKHLPPGGRRSRDIFHVQYLHVFIGFV